MQMRINQEGTKSIQKSLRNGSKIHRFTTHSHISINCKAKPLYQLKFEAFSRKQVCPERGGMTLASGTPVPTPQGDLPLREV